MCLHSAKSDLSENDILHVSGSFDGVSSLMVQSKLRLVSNAKCQKFYDDKKYFVSLPNGIDDSLFCAYIDDETSKFDYGNKTFSVSKPNKKSF